MPEILSKARDHPFRVGVGRSVAAASPGGGDEFVEVVATSNYTFLTGASHPEELMTEAAAQGYSAIGIADTNTLAGVVRAHCAAKEAGVRCIVGSRIVLADAPELSLAVYPTDRASYGRLSRLLTVGKRRAEKGGCHLTLADLADHHRGLLAVAIPAQAAVGEKVRTALGAVRDMFDADDLSIAARIRYGSDDSAGLRGVAEVASWLGVALVATNDVLYHVPQRRPLQDVLTCIRLGTTVEAAGYELLPNAERHLKPAREMVRLFAAHPLAIRRSLEIAERTGGFSLDQLRYEYPDEVCPSGVSPMQHLRDLTWAGADERYPEGLPAAVRSQIEHELRLIDELRYAPYFLTVHDIVRYARSRGILCQGRGAAANSAVCYCLGVTSVDPARIQLLFERFVSKERDEPPDIDIDFEHERREEVLQYIYGKYGRERAALTAEVISYRGKSAIRDVGKAMGLSMDCVNQLSKTLGWWDRGEIPTERLVELGLDPDDRTLRLVLTLAGQIHGFPRHLSQHVGGFVITRGPLCESVPIENAAMEDRTVIEWDKDDIDAMGMLKVDCLGLGMLSCIRRCFGLIRRHHGRDLTLANIPPEDPDVYDMICKADTIGVFQIESRAQMSMLPRLRPRCFYDIVIEVAIVRPGPIQGKMVHPYLRRRSGEEPAVYPNEAVRKVLGRTLGVPLFQEQAMSLAIVAAGFTPGQADQLRRAMAAWKRKGDAIERFGRQLIEGMLRNGYPREFAERCFEQIKGFSEYGFPESHAASFALLVYVSCWLKHHYPGAFAAALINSQPMGFYAPAQIVRDAKEHGVPVRPIDIGRSDWDCTLEDDGKALRLGMRLTKGLSEEHARQLVQERVRGGEFKSVLDLRRRCSVPVAALRALARADAFASMGLDRQHALWAIQGMHDREAPLFDALTRERPDEAAAELPTLAGDRLVHEDYRATGLSLKAHPISFLRERLASQGASTAREIGDAKRFPHGRLASVGGVVLVRQRPATASGIVFITLEDETGVANLIVRPEVFERYRAAAKMSASLCASGRIERSGEVVHVHVSSLESLDGWQDAFGSRSRDFR
ncbi:MAG: error-prone DNA polymerase [Phycisphaerales bacterium]|nr:error-prone DNA polymerase [Phycisphaerales bacterium]